MTYNTDKTHTVYTHKCYLHTYNLLVTKYVFINFKYYRSLEANLKIRQPYAAVSYTKINLAHKILHLLII